VLRELCEVSLTEILEQMLRFRVIVNVRVERDLPVVCRKQNFAAGHYSSGAESASTGKQINACHAVSPWGWGLMNEKGTEDFRQA